MTITRSKKTANNYNICCKISRSTSKLCTI